jgi:hypothetical protein
MRSLIKLSLQMIACLSVSSCGVQVPISKMQPANNKTYQIEYLFEHDGCKVYRFIDEGHYIYFTNCKGDVTSIEKDSVQTHVINRIK